MLNEVLINGTAVVETRKEGRSRVWELESSEVVENKNVDEYGLKCSGCGKVNTLSQLTKSRHLDKEYFCQSCNKKGKNNPFYGKSHDEEAKSKIGGASDDVDYSGENNPMYGENPYEKLVEKHGEKDATRIWENKKENHSERMGGESNPFYGKTHDETAVEKIRRKNKEYWNSLTPKKQIERLGVSIGELEEMYDFYASEKGSRETFNKKYEICFRTACKYWKKFNIGDVENLVKEKKMGGSAKEEKMYEKLKKAFGEVKRQHEINGYFYDFKIGDLLIELDGYYWHKVIEDTNDETKRRLANQNEYDLYRVEENKNRNINYNKELAQIKSIL